MTQNAKKRGPGRPVDAKRLAAILDAARTVFLDGGFEGFSIESVAARAGVSKVTIYKHFETRENLIGELIGRESVWMEELATDTLETLPVVESTLIVFGSKLLQFLARPDVIALDARMLQAPPAYRNVVARYFAEGPARLMVALEGLLEGAIASGIVQGNKRDAASDLLALWLTAIPLPVRLGLAPLPSAQALNDHTVRTTRLFLRAFASSRAK
jgi:TetR/AcrR family transcriptional regulator, mexJK operon transcriptional repressor